MKNLLGVVLSFLLFFQPTFAQTYSRKHFDYDKMEEKVSAGCTDDVNQKLQEAASMVENNNSSEGVSIAEAVFKKGEATACVDLYIVYAECLFRNGKWEEGLSISEQGIEKYGPDPELLSRKGNMCLEMAELGLGQKHIDGSAVYSGKDKDKYDEAAFKEENYKTAAKDYEYIVNTYDKRYQEIMILAYINKQLKNYEVSDKYFQRLMSDDSCDEEYRARSTMFLAENYMVENKIKEAEKLLLQLEEKYPRTPTIQEKRIDLYVLEKDEAKVNERKKQKYFYELIP